jgi:hypothetical protein
VAMADPTAITVKSAGDFVAKSHHYPLPVLRRAHQPPPGSSGDIRGTELLPRAGHASRIPRAPVAQEHVGRVRGRGHAAFGSSVEAGRGGQSSEIGLLSSHLRKAATAVAVNRSRPLSALANVCLDKPSALAKRDCGPRFPARTPCNSNLH